MKEKQFSKDFVLVVIGQIISLFGNATIRFALPLYLLNQTGSSAIYGIVTAGAFIPTILLSPVGGMIADRVNKRNIMVILDFFTAMVVAGFTLLLEAGNLVLFLTVTLMILYGIAGAYQPAVQASIPSLVRQEQIMAANSITNTISSFASLLGPVFGGILYSAYGLKPVLWVCTVCFTVSAIMEIFIHIPYQKQERKSSIRQVIRSDFSESIQFIRKEKPIIGKVVLTACGINLFLSSMIMVAMPYLITEVLAFETAQANRFYGYATGVMGAGGLAGGICAGIFAKKLHMKKAGKLLLLCAFFICPMGIVQVLSVSAMTNYLVLTVCCFFVMLCATVFTVQVMSFVQTETPQHLIGKVIAVILTVSMCAQPLGNAVYGMLFEWCRGYEYVVLFLAGIVSAVIAGWLMRMFKEEVTIL